MSDQTFLDGKVTLLAGDCMERLRSLADCSVDSVCCDPPYHLTSIVKRFGAEGSAPCKEGKTGAYARASRGFMGKTWDGGDIAFRPDLWAEVLRVLKPGGHMVAFSGTRTYHRMVCAIEDAGFEIRDQLAWVYGTGFPKSHDVSKGIDKAAAAATREVVGRAPDWKVSAKFREMEGRADRPTSILDIITAPATDLAKQWAGWGTALKPALEPICLARKPLSEGTVAANVLAHGTGAINVDACRILTADKIHQPSTLGTLCGAKGTGWDRPCKNDAGWVAARDIRAREAIARTEALGRFPANLIHDGSPEVLAAFPDAPGQQGAVTGTEPSDCHSGVYSGPRERQAFAKRGDAGSAARFFYSAKADADDRIGSAHPTVKPVDLMRWLVRLVTPPGGTTLDPFAGTGTTGEAAWREGMRAILIEREEEYRADITRRMSLCLAGPVERKVASIKARGRDVEHPIDLLTGWDAA